MKLDTAKVLDIMRDRGINQSMLAEIMRCHRQRVHTILHNGKHSHTLKTVQRIGEALDVDPKTLIN